jgi:hypothetical protein
LRRVELYRFGTLGIALTTHTEESMPMKAVSVSLTVLAVAQVAFAESTIVYGPYQFSGSLNEQLLDMNQDGTNDFTFDSEWLITMDVPTSGIGYFFGVLPAADNYVLGFGSRVAALSPGDSISSVPVGAASWQHPRYGPVGVCSWTADLRRGTWSGWAGAMTGLDETFLGLRFSAADGDHLGWVRVRLNGSDTSGMARLVDYAYERRPDSQILAGAVPEPSAAVLLGIGVVATWLFARLARIACNPCAVRHKEL